MLNTKVLYTIYWRLYCPAPVASVDASVPHVLIENSEQALDMIVK